MIGATLGLIALLASTPAPLATAVRSVGPDTFAVQAEDVPDTRARVDVGLGILSLTGSAIAGGITAGCTATRECREVNPIIARWIGDGIGKAIVLKAVIQGAVHYVVYRFAPKGRIRTGALAILAAANVADATHDIRVLRDIQRRRE